MITLSPLAWFAIGIVSPFALACVCLIGWCLVTMLCDIYRAARDYCRDRE